ncbi:ketoacyl-synt-domain-containing protein [Aspergillus ambiguus]|uniref:ketoacyl-synt-domain-containing protein n=1 Tax=Aspergillus ambiguus TaxID=176160 RepID=UPI003CCCC29F
MPIAVVGISGRFPGDATEPGRLWELLLNAKTARIEVPKDRFNVDAFYHPHAERNGTHNFRSGHFLAESLAAFDAPFFSITPNEARAMDPQQRLCLELAYESLENAGIPLDKVSGTNTSCYVGSFCQDYQNLMSRDPENLPFYNITGTGTACLSNRVSWFYNLVGPSMTIDTACSSSLVALHLACQSLRTGESTMALAGGVNILCSPEMNTKMSFFHFNSPDGKSKAFDEKADGYSRAEGCCFLVLKPLESALRDNNIIRAVIRNTGSNQDGHTPGLTLPSRSSQANLIKRVYDEAGLPMSQTGYFEAHGTGTIAGDSTETRAVGETIGKSRSPDMPLFMGSIKANIGHMEGASGLASVIKTIYILEHGLIPGQIWLENLNPRIKAKEWNLTFPKKLTHWPFEGLRRASVNSFGFAGANAHVILDDAAYYLKSRGLELRHNTQHCGRSMTTGIKDLQPLPSCVEHKQEQAKDRLANRAPRPPSPILLIWSSHEQDGVKRMAESWHAYAATKCQGLTEAEKETLLEQMAFTAAVGRTRFPWKSFTVCSSMQDLLQSPIRLEQPIRSSQSPKLCFVFTGQGAQYFNMGRELMLYPVYAQSMQTADTYLKTLGCPWSLTGELLKDQESSRVNEPDYSQPLCTALQIALVDLLTAFDVCPTAVVGHSSGEIAAAYAIGALSREDALLTAYHRGRLSSLIMEFNPELRGGMLAASLSERDATSYIQRVTKGHLVVACVNSPASVTISGDLAAIRELESELKTNNIFARQLKVDTAYHSPHMETIGQLYRDSISTVARACQGTSSSAATKAKMFSSVTGEIVDPSDLGPNYWVANLLGQVKFMQAIESMVSHSHTKRKSAPQRYSYVDIMVEIGPHGALQGPINQTLSASERHCASISLLDRKSDASVALLHALGRLFQHGYNTDVTSVNIASHVHVPEKSLLVDLPSFPWNHTRGYWYESALSSNYRFRNTPRKDLLGSRDNEGNEYEARWRQFFRLKENPWIEDHCVQGQIVYPAAGMIVMALEAVAEITRPDKPVEGYELRDVVIKNAIIVPRSDEGVETILHLRRWRTGSLASGSVWQEFRIYSRSGTNPWSDNCTGLIRTLHGGEDIPFRSTRKTHGIKWEPCNATSEQYPALTPTDFYTKVVAMGFQFGPAFQNITEFRKAHDSLWCTVRIPDIASHMPHGVTDAHVVHPCTLDPIIHSALGILDDDEGARVPTSLKRLFISARAPTAPGTLLAITSSVQALGLRDAEADILATVRGSSELLIAVEAVNMTRVGGSDASPSTSRDTPAESKKIVSRVEWREDISYLQGEYRPDLLTSNSKAQSTRSANSSPLTQYIELITHKNPSAAILEIGAAEGNTTKQMLEAISPVDGESTPWAKEYVATECDEDAVRRLKELFSQWGPHFDAKLLSFSQDGGPQGLHAPQTYDCVILHAPRTTNMLEDAIRYSADVMKEHGKLIILQPDIPDSGISLWDHILRRYHLTGIDCSFPEYRSETQWFASMTVSTLGPNRPNMSFPKALIVTPCKRSTNVQTLVTSLAGKLHQQGFVSDSKTLLDLTSVDLSNTCSIVLSELESPTLFDMDSVEFSAIKSLVLGSKQVLWVTAGGTIDSSNPHAALITGLSRSIRHEHPEVLFATIDLEWPIDDVVASSASIVNVLHSLLGGNSDREFAIRAGRVMIPRVRFYRQLNNLWTQKGRSTTELGPLVQQHRPLTLEVGSPGSLDSMYFKDDVSYIEPLQEDDIEIQVKATGLNFLDVMVAADQIKEPTLGFECSGIVRRAGASVTRFKPGDRVMTWRFRAFSTFMRSPECMVHPIPVGMTFATAASLPVVYCTAYEALIVAARLRPREQILIHGAAGGVGQAAIMIARSVGAEIFATVSSEAKMKHLVDTYGIGEDHIFFSRDLSFADDVLRATQGRGVDVVLNSLAGEALRQSWLCLAWFGRFIELGKKDILENTGLDMGQFIKNISFHSINILGGYRENLPRTADIFAKAIDFYYANHCQPVSPIHVMSYSDIQEGFRLLLNGKQAGKVVFTISEGDIVPTAPVALRPAVLDPKNTFLIVGGFGGLGQYISRWMVQHGARNLLFLSRRGLDNPENRAFIEELQLSGVNAVSYACDIGNLDQVERAFSRSSANLPPIRGIIIAAMSLSDATFANMTVEQWMSSIKTKAWGAWNIHRAAPQDLDFFVMLSSVSGISGPRGQGNYAAGNTFLDALAHYRRGLGFTAVSFDVAAVSDVGYLSKRSELLDSLTQQGFVPIVGSELISILQAAVNGITPPQVITGLITGGEASSQNIDYPYYLDDAKMAHVRCTGAVTNTSEKFNSWQEKLGNIRSISDGIGLVICALRERLALQMRIAVEDVDASKPISAYGIDSLTAVEVRAWCLRNLQADISIFDIVSNTPMSNLAETIVRISRYTPAEFGLDGSRD